MADALLVSSSFLPGRGGIESYLAELCDDLAPRLAVLAAARREGRALPSDLGYPTHPFDGRLLIPGRAAARATIAAARRENTDRVLFGTPWPLVLIAPRLRRAGLRYAVIVHGAELTVPAAVPGVQARLARALAGADLLLPVSDYTARRTRALLEKFEFAVPAMEVLRARVDLALFSPEADGAAARRRLGLAEQDRVVLCFGRLVARKGVDRLIRALDEVARRVPDALLVVAGTGPEEKKLRRLARRRRARVVFAGRVPEEDAPGVYAAADVFALAVADRWFGLEIEGLGVVLLEAAACGVPCVTGRSGGTPEAVVDGSTGFVVDSTNESGLARRIVDLLTDPSLAARLGAEGRRHVERNFARRAVPGRLVAWLEG